MSKKKKRKGTDFVFMTNDKYAHESEMFRRACKDAGVEPTGRQAGKFRRGTGLAYKTMMERKRMKK